MDVIFFNSYVTSIIWGENLLPTEYENRYKWKKMEMQYLLSEKCGRPRVPYFRTETPKK